MINFLMCIYMCRISCPITAQWALSIIRGLILVGSINYTISNINNNIGIIAWICLYFIVRIGDWLVLITDLYLADEVFKFKSNNIQIQIKCQMLNVSFQSNYPAFITYQSKTKASAILWNKSINVTGTS